VMQQHDVLAAEGRVQLLDAVDVDDGGAVDANELDGIELRLDVAHRSSHEVRLGADVQADVVPRRLAPVDVVRAHEIDASTGLDDEAVAPLRHGRQTGRSARAQVLPRVQHGRLEA